MAVANTTNNAVVAVADNATPPLSASNAFSIMVNPLAPVVLGMPKLANGQFNMQVSGTTGPDYIIEESTNLLQWSNLMTNLSPTTPFQFSDPAAGSFSDRFYQVRLAP